MLNIAEIITILIGAILSLAVVDGFRRANKIRKRNKERQIKNILSEDETFIEEKVLEDSSEWVYPSSKESLNSSQNSETSDQHKLIIVNINAEEEKTFSYPFLSENLSLFNPHYEEKGFFIFRDSEDSVLFSLLNGRKPGTFLNNNTSPDISLVLDLTNSVNPVEALDLLFSVAHHLSETAQCKVLDENRNLLTRQMEQHLRYQTQEYQRQRIPKVS